MRPDTAGRNTQSIVADLQMLLLQAVRDRIGDENVRTGFRFLGFEQDRHGSAATFRDTASGADAVNNATVLIGADGIHSAVRHASSIPDEGEPRFARQILWRAAVEAEAFLDGRTHGHCRAFPSAHHSLSNGPRAGIDQIADQLDLPDDRAGNELLRGRIGAGASRSRRCSRPSAPGGFRGSTCRTLIEQTSEIFEFPLMDRDPLPCWTFGRVTLLGDAAHPMQPIGAQAGSQAIIDARVLTAALLSSSDPERALQRYDRERRPVMNDIVIRNRQFGPEAALQLVEERAPNGFDRIEEVISREDLETITGSFSAAAGLDVETVNTRRSFLDPI